MVQRDFAPEDPKKTAPRKKRKNKYIPGIAALQFRPQFDWEPAEALSMFQNAHHDIQTNNVLYEDCILGMQHLPPDCVDLIVADCPFGLNFSGKEGFYNRNENFVVDDYAEVNGDYTSFTSRWIGELSRIMKPTASAFLFSGWTNLHIMLNAINKTNLTLINHIIWIYQFGVFTKRKFVTSHYHILFVAKDPDHYFFNKIEHYPLDCWQIPRTYSPGEEKNGTKLPDEVVKRCIDFGSRPGDLVFDPFMGNGTTAVVAKGTYRHYFGFEINPKIQPIITENLQSVSLGSLYQPYRLLCPSQEELEKKYPQAAKLLRSKKN